MQHAQQVRAVCFPLERIAGQCHRRLSVNITLCPDKSAVIELCWPTARVVLRNRPNQNQGTATVDSKGQPLFEVEGPIRSQKGRWRTYSAKGVPMSAILHAISLSEHWTARMLPACECENGSPAMTLTDKHRAARFMGFFLVD